MILKIRLCKGITERDLEYSPYYYFESKSESIKMALLEFIAYKNKFISLRDYPEICDYEEIKIVRN